MSKDLIAVSPLPLALTAPQEEIAELQEAIAMNSGSGGMSEFDLPRITIAPGSFKVPTANGTALVERIEGVVVYIRDIRVYYKLKDQGSRPPDCSSTDCVVGHGEPGGRCIPQVDQNGKVTVPGCPLAVFESATTPDGKQGKGQACKQVKQLYMLRGDSLMPEVLCVPPTSLKAARKFFNWLMGQRLPYPKALVAITVQNAKNTQSKEYGTAVFDLVRRLTPEEVQRTLLFNAMCEQFLKGAAVNVPITE
jgi:hypothetical protein